MLTPTTSGFIYWPSPVFEIAHGEQTTGISGLRNAELLKIAVPQEYIYRRVWVYYEQEAGLLGLDIRDIVLRFLLEGGVVTELPISCLPRFPSNSGYGFSPYMRGFPDAVTDAARSNISQTLQFRASLLGAWRLIQPFDIVARCDNLQLWAYDIADLLDCAYLLACQSNEPGTYVK